MTSEVLSQENAIVLAATERMLTLGQTISEGIIDGKQKKEEYFKGKSILTLLTAYDDNIWSDDDLESVLYLLRDLSEASLFPAVSPIVGQELVYLIENGGIRVANNGVLLPFRNVINFQTGLEASDDGSEIDVINTDSGGTTPTTGAVVYCGEWDLSTDVVPTTGGTGTAGAIQAGNQFLVAVSAATLLGPDGGLILKGYMAQAKLNAPGMDLADTTKWILFMTITA